MDMYFSFAGRHSIEKRASYRNFAFSTTFLFLSKCKNQNNAKSGFLFFFLIVNCDKLDNN